MWKLLPICLLVSCAANDQQPASGEDRSSQGRIVRQVELPVGSSAQTTSGQPVKKTFQRQGMSGWLDETGDWHISSEVHHGRLRCATYETGIQLGRGNPACSDVEWLTGVEYATRLRHCNSATRIHAGGGELADGANRFAQTTCVRVVVRCEGTC
jgi:hypothetical protein